MEAKSTTRNIFAIWFLVIFTTSLIYGEQTAVKSRTKLPRGMKTTDLIPTWNYLLHLPTGYTGKSHPWPLIVYLHGASIRGNDMDSGLNPVKRYGIPAFLDRHPDFPFVVVSPQLPEDNWPAKSLLNLVDEVMARYNVDRDRVYLTGVDIGGEGAWHLAAADQRKFSAVAPVCGFGDMSLVPDLTDIPIWGFHGDADKVKAVGPHKRLIEAIQREGGDAKITVIPGGTHGDVIFPTYQRKDLYEWFLSHSRKVAPLQPIFVPKPEVKPQPVPELTTKEIPDRVFASKKNVHLIKKGDTLWRISQTYKVSVDALRKANGLRDNTIRIGEELVIPGT